MYPAAPGDPAAGPAFFQTPATLTYTEIAVALFQTPATLTQ